VRIVGAGPADKIRVGLMRMKPRGLWVPTGVLIGLFITTAPAATAANTPAPQRITGTVQTVIREQPRGRHIDANDTIKVLRVGTKLIPLTDGSLLTTRDGTSVSVTVAPASDGTKRVLSASTISAPVAAAIPSSVHQVYVALVLPVGLTADASITDASARAMVIKVSNYWSSQTGNKVSFVTSQVQSYRSAYSCGDTYNMWAEALLKMPAASGPGKHLVLVAPGGADYLGCDYGLGTVGAVEATGNEVFVSGLDQSLLAHELGHNLGLYHSNSLRCSGTQDMPRVGFLFPGCQANPYDDLLDVMGYSGTNYGEGSLNAVHLDGMHLLPNAVRKIPANSGVTTTRITPLSSTTDNRTLKITDPNGANYFVEYRTNSGRDAVAGRNPWHPSWGVRVLRDDPDAPPSAGSYELDATPTSSNNDYNRSIPVGGTFTAASASVTIKVTEADAAGATLTIADWAAPIVPFKATVSLPTKAWVGTAITAATRVTDLHDRATANWIVTLQKMQRGTSTWKSVKSLRTTSTGAGSYRFANGVSGYYRWVTSPATGAPSKVSPPVAVTSIARVIEKRPATSMTHGTYLSVYGSVSSVPAPVVYIQYRYGSGIWHTGPRATVRGTAVSGRIVMTVKTTAYTRLYIRTATSYVGSIFGSYPTTVR
jgi:hypothetical protein